MKQKLYIFFTYDISTVGGTQMYTAGKARYLQSRGWQVAIFCDHFIKDHSDIPYLNQYMHPNAGMDFLARPPYKIRQHEIKYCLNFMVRQLNISDPNDYEILIESHADVQAYWAELLALVLGARHFFVACNEVFRNFPGRFYEDNLDFFYFKWKRKEMVDDFGDTIVKLFNGYKNVTKPLFMPPFPTVREMDAIQDVDFKIENIERLDWNICHIGRAVKNYVPYVIKGVGELARRYPDKRINFIMVGEADSLLELLKKTFNGCSNIHVTLLGNMVPIPRILFTKVDVVCAISQTALFTVNEDVPTICATVTDETRTPGLLGYDTEDPLYAEGTYSYVEALENVLLKRLYDGRKNSLTKIRPAEEYYDAFWSIVEHADPTKEYYAEQLSKERIREWTAIFPFGTVARGARIILFGENDIAKDYRKQIDSQKNSAMEFGKDYVKHLKPQPYCQILATVDEHPEEFDDSVVGLERLKTQDYDVIIICLPSELVQDAYNKIIQIAPEATDKVIHAFNWLFT